MPARRYSGDPTIYSVAIPGAFAIPIEPVVEAGLNIDVPVLVVNHR